MGVYGGPEITSDGLVLALDGANYKSFKGEPTTNLTRNSRDFSGTAYASDDQWADNPTVLSKTYISSIVTPIGNGATLIQESGSNGYHHLSRWGGADESGAHSLSCYVFPLISDITDFVIGMLGDSNNQISFNLNTRAITYGPGISNRDAFITPVVGFDGWYRVGANIEGRGGGWVGCIGYTTSAVYTGTSGNKKCYITGIQYELKTKPTMFVEAQTTRGTTVATGGGWADLTGRGNNGELVNGVRESSDNLGSLLFDGTNDYISGSLGTLNAPFTLEIFGKFNNVSQNNYEYFGSVGDFSENGMISISKIGTQDPNSSYHGFMYVYPGSGDVRKTNIDLRTTNYQHLVVILLSSSPYIRVYKNGVEGSMIDALSAPINTNGNYRIGTWGNNTWWLNGNIAITKIYNRALTAAEIRQNFNATRSRFGI